MSKRKHPDRQVEYVPPDPETIRAYARNVCQRLAECTNDPVFMQPHVVRGLAQFLMVAAQVKAKQLNSEQMVDSDRK